jgi:chromosome segregation ATPase
MTDSFAKNDSEALILLRERVREGRDRDQKVDDKLDKILDTLHKMDTKTQIIDHGLTSLSAQHSETKARLDAVEDDKRGVWAHVASVISQIALWGAK